MAEEVLRETYDPSLTTLANHGNDIRQSSEVVHLREHNTIGTECNIETRERQSRTSIIKFAAGEVTVLYTSLICTDFKALPHKPNHWYLHKLRIDPSSSQVFPGLEFASLFNFSIEKTTEFISDSHSICQLCT